MSEPREIGLSTTNRVGIAPDATGVPMLCYAGSKKSLALLQGIPGMQRWEEFDCVAMPLDRTSILMVESVGRIEESTAEYQAVRNQFLQAPLDYAVYYPPTPEGEPEPLKHQVETLCWALKCFSRGFKGFGIWSEQGTGKSRTACDLIRALKPEVTLLIIQNSTSLQWFNWMQRICPDYEVRMLTGIPLLKRAQLIKDAIFRPTIFIINWEAIARLQGEIVSLRPDVVIADECSRAKERNSLMSKALAKIGAVARHRFGLSGTPLGNSPADIWALYRFLEPSLFDRSYWAFAEKYFNLGGYTGKEFTSFNPQQVANFIGRMYSCAFRTTKASIGDLPEKSFEVIELEMAGEQKELYEQVEKDLYARRVKEDGTVETLSIANALAQAIRLQQITSGLFPVDSEGEKAECRIIESVKTKWLLDYCCESLATSDNHILVWCRFRDEIQAICRGLWAKGLIPGEDFFYIDGSIKLKERERARDDFNNSSNPLRILIMQTAAGAYGMDLPRADTLLYHSNSFSHIERSQSLERGHRLGRIRPYTVIDLVYKWTVDEKILRALKRKESLSEMLLVDGF